jgi:hypothetical protein
VRIKYIGLFQSKFFVYKLIIRNLKMLVKGVFSYSLNNEVAYVIS